MATLQIVKKLPYDSGSRVIIDQLVRSVTSIGANLLEARSASSKKDFINFFTHALKSANESKFWFGLLRDAKYLSATVVNPLLTETTEIARILAASIMTMKNKK